MKQYMRPLVEKFYKGYLMEEERRQQATAICRYLSRSYTAEGAQEAKQGYYQAVIELLNSSDTYRIMLFLPFPELAGAPAELKAAYKHAWQCLCLIEDTRENFYHGHTLGVDIHPTKQDERIVKATHLVPWLLQTGCLEFQDLVSVVSQNKSREPLLRGVRDCLHYIGDHKILNTDEIRQLYLLTREIGPRVGNRPRCTPQPLSQWLNQGHHTPVTLQTPDAHLEGPFWINLPPKSPQIQQILHHLEPTEIVMVGGAWLKGYGTHDSQPDIWRLSQVEAESRFSKGRDPYLAPVIFNTIWLGGSQMDNLAQLAQAKAKEYIGGLHRAQVLACLELDLLLCRLLHRGYARFYGRDYLLQNYPEMDGDCPFYNDGYRRLASMLYAKYVYLPR